VAAVQTVFPDACPTTLGIEGLIDEPLNSLFPGRGAWALGIHAHILFDQLGGASLFRSGSSSLPVTGSVQALPAWTVDVAVRAAHSLAALEHVHQVAVVIPATACMIVVEAYIESGPNPHSP
jgi:hypothetical protein